MMRRSRGSDRDVARAPAEAREARIVLVGSYPPPYGGNSVHVERLHRALAAEGRVAVIDAYGAPRPGDAATVVRCGRGALGMLRALVTLRSSRATLVHVHVSGLRRFLPVAGVFLGCVPPRARTVITLHSGSFVASFERASQRRRTRLLRVLRRFDRVVAVNDEQRRFLEALGFPAGRIAVVPAFLPPASRESARARAAVAALDGARPIVVTSGCALPHYGFHIVLAAMARLEPAHRPALLICAYDAFDEAYLAELARATVRHVLVRDFDAGEFGWILQRADAYVRATDRDGDAVAIREALHFGAAVVASDCVARPAGVRLFRTGDAASLAEALRSLPARNADPAASRTGENNLAALRELYHTAADRR